MYVLSNVIAYMWLPFPQLGRAHQNWYNCQVWWRDIAKFGHYGHAKFAHFIYCLAFQAEVGTESTSALE